MSTALKHTPLYDLHLELDARMTGFAGYDMPLQFAGVMAEHLATRAGAGLFDVSHMGQIRVTGPDWAQVALALETVIPIDVLGLAPGRQRYGFLTDPGGGLRDDLMLARMDDAALLVVNAACKDADLDWLRDALPPAITLTPLPDRALLALQGPGAEDALASINPAVRAMRFMDVTALPLPAVTAWISRSGYTGEDGFEISIPADAAEDLARHLLDQPGVVPVGLGARDSLRLEAGLCLYGQDIDTTTTPASAGLSWAIPPVRRSNGARAGGFIGADVILPELPHQTPQVRTGLRPDGRAPIRAGALVFADAGGETAIGRITSGGFGPSVAAPIAMALIDRTHATPGTPLWADLRGKRLPVTTCPLPFVPARFKR